MRRSPRAGFTLIELLAILFALSVLMLVTVALLAGAVGIQQADAAAYGRLTVQSALADRFRDDVAGAVAVADALEDSRTGPECLILRRSDDSHIVYRWDGEQVERREIDDRGEARQRLPLRVEKGSVQFLRIDREPRLLILRIIESRGVGGMRRDRVLDISAALAGDLR